MNPQRTPLHLSLPPLEWGGAVLGHLRPVEVKWSDLVGKKERQVGPSESGLSPGKANNRSCKEVQQWILDTPNLPRDCGASVHSYQKINEIKY